MSQATSWVSHLAANPDPKYPNQGYCKEITDEFGKDLEFVLGPKNIRVPYDQISQKEVEERLENVNEKLFIQTRNSKQTMLASLQQLLRHLQDTKALWGIDLPIMNFMPMKGTKKHPIEMLWINYRSQRNIYARHIVQLIFKFDPYSVFNGIGRMTSDLRKLFINDGQHRTLACMIFGVRYIAVQYIISDDESVDIDQFCACNVDNLPSEAYDNYNNRKERCKAYLEAGKIPVREDKFMWDIGQWAERWNINICRVGEDKGRRGISHMQDLFKSAQMGIDVMDAAAAVLVTVYPNDEMKSANLVGLCELLSQQDPDWLEIAYTDPDNFQLSPQLEELSRVLRLRFGISQFQQNSGTYHSQCKEAINNWWKTKFNTNTNPSGISSEVKVAHATFWVYEEFGDKKYKMAMPRNKKGENYEVLASFTQGYKKWLKTQSIKV
jgi:hypothetical protein